MSTHTHTPGPWNCKSPRYRRLSAGIVRDAFNDPIADCRYSEVPIRDKKTPEQIDANARLIAAAPELLEALKACVEALEFIPCRARNEARVVIAKAERRG